MAKPGSERSAQWRRRLLLKSSIFDDLNAERAARIRRAFPDDDRPEVRAVVEFFANYPRCQHAPIAMELDSLNWSVLIDELHSFELAAALQALSEVTSLPCILFHTNWMRINAPQGAINTVREEVAEMRALGLWGRS